MTTCEPTSEVGLSKIGFISTCGATRAASACIACARPISWPSRVANEFSAMFCALNGATSKPSCRRMRHNAPTVSDLPASEAVPNTINAFAKNCSPLHCRVALLSLQQEQKHRATQQCCDCADRKFAGRNRHSRQRVSEYQKGCA